MTDLRKNPAKFSAKNANRRLAFIGHFPNALNQRINNMRQRSDFLILSILFCVAAIMVVFAAMTGGGHISTIAARVGPVNSGALSLLFGAFCALWAQNTHRNAWLWFFAGLFFNVFAIAVLLYKNSADVKANVAAHTPSISH